MLESSVKKVIAKDGERLIVDSSYEEFSSFILGERRPDFADERIICVKFLKFYGEDDENPEESDWYINPYYCTDEYGNSNCLMYESAYGPKMDSEFVPEILLVDHTNVIEVIKRYDTFNTILMIEGKTNLSDEVKYTLFLEMYNELD